MCCALNFSCGSGPSQLSTRACLHAPKSHPLQPPSHLLRGGRRGEELCRQKLSTVCRRLCTVVNDLGSSASCELLNKCVCLQETICQRANAARPRLPLRSTKMLQSGACVFQLSLTLRRCNTSAERDVYTEHHDVLCCFTASLHPYKQHCTQKFLAHRSQIRLNPRSRHPSCRVTKQARHTLS